MNLNTDIPNKLIAEYVSQALEDKQLSIRACCDSFNEKFKKEIKKETVKALNKDFLLRVKKGDFETINKRIVHFCEFIGIPINDQVAVDAEEALSTTTNNLFEQITDLETYVSKHPHLKKRFKKLLLFLTEINDAYQKEKL